MTTIRPRTVIPFRRRQSLSTPVSEVLCPCGQPLHYSDPDLKASVDFLVSQLGWTVAVKISTGTYYVPRHYIALHGISARELPYLAAEYDWRVEQESQQN
jgi:hypothetical protein